MTQKYYGSKKVLWHHDKMDSFRKGIITSPIQVRVKPTNKCNHRCYYCAYDVNSPEETRVDRTAELPCEKMFEILKDFKDMGVKAVTYSGGGEPLIYPYIEEVLKKTLDYGIDLSMITNGQNLEGKKAEYLKKAKWIRISLDSCNASTFSDTRGISKRLFYKLVENLRNFILTKSKDCIVGINFVVQEKNYDKIYDSIKFLKGLGVNNIKITPRYVTTSLKEYHSKYQKVSLKQIEKARTDFPDFEIYDTYSVDFDKIGIPKREYIRCYFMQIVPAISATGEVYPCHDKAWIGIDSLGSIMEQSFKELWFSEKTAEIFKKFNPIEKCNHHCTNDLKNLEIIDYLKCCGNHINFP